MEDVLWIAAFFLVCFGANAIKPEGKQVLSTSGLVGGSILCVLAFACSVGDIIYDGGLPSWLMLLLVCLMTGLAVFFRIRAMRSNRS
jgi:hypothetical protein